MKSTRSALKSIRPKGDVTLIARLRPHEMRGSGRRKNSTMSAFVEISDELIGAVEMSMSDDRDVAVCALGIVRDGVITGEGPTTRGRIHFSRALDARDAAWCARILTATAVADEPVSRAEAEALFEINAAATFAKAIVHHAASASGLPVPSRTIALSPHTDFKLGADPCRWPQYRSAGMDRWPDPRQPHRDEAGRSHYRRGHTAAGAASELVRYTLSSEGM
jgi:hypothetical protein